MSNNVGPVCHIPPPNTPGNPQPRNMPGIPGPVGTGSSQADINALLNALRQALLTLLGMLNNNNNATGTITSPKPSKPAQWNETNRVTSTVKIFQNNDPTSPNFVEVEQINSLTMTDKSTGNTWVWKRSG
jgi:hypothetical protein